METAPSAPGLSEGPLRRSRLLKHGQMAFQPGDASLLAFNSVKRAS